MTRYGIALLVAAVSLTALMAGCKYVSKRSNTNANAAKPVNPTRTPANANARATPGPKRTPSPKRTP
jgi:hypothetical protein